jgi:calpain-15
VLLLEKAWAKLFGSYYKIEAGFAEDVFRDLSGAPSEIVHNDDEKLFDKLLEGEEKGFMMAASAGSTKASKELLESLGLIGNHSYGLLDAKIVKLSNGLEEKLVRLRNPWGDFEWKGDWSDDSDLWTPELKKKLGWTDTNDGTFWMNIDDFTHYFSRV